MFGVQTINIDSLRLSTPHGQTALFVAVKTLLIINAASGNGIPNPFKCPSLRAPPHPPPHSLSQMLECGNYVSVIRTWIGLSMAKSVLRTLRSTGRGVLPTSNRY